jgi:2-keto-4-pentenoate hydratase/2-oxohepta-3-ene-1,7-dioic acid hydratase in catechol pathway
MLAADGSIRDLAEHVSDITGSTFAPEMLQTLAALDPKALPLVAGSPRLGACLRGVGKFIGIGLNYSDHAAESGMEVPKEPVVFMKATSAITGPNDAVTIPRDSKKTDWEAELGVVIGREARYVEEGCALLRGWILRRE